MKPTRASRFRQAAGGPGDGSDINTRRAGITTKRTPSCSVSPAARGKQQGRQAELDQDTCKGESEVSASVPRYMKPTAASHLKRGGPQPPPREAPQNRKQQQRQKQSLFRGRASPSALDDPLWQKLQKRTKQPVVARGGQDPAAASASPSLLASSIGSRDTVLAGSTVAENSPASSPTT
ncbi:uncharacterized protein P884DRAFT_278471 [Thermothelomyces heterothallicus CBS 202.75]|uniref:uncharacterized protein n=1 Tax=Thermothelomyces heterothallicus CBS 202.75 TaxID=1149848 RepID=UPI0037435D56